MQYSEKRVSSQHGRQNDNRTTAQVHVVHQGQGHQARDDCAPLSAHPRLPLQDKRQTPARHPRYCIAQIPHRHLYQRLLLARPRRMQVLCNAQDKHRILAEEDRPQPPTRHRKTHPTAPPRLAHNHHLGVRTDAQEPPHHPTGFGTDPEQDISTQQRHKGHNPLLMRRRERWNGGGSVSLTHPITSVILSSTSITFATFCSFA